MTQTTNLDWLVNADGGTDWGARHAGVLAFVVISLCVTMSYTQLVNLEQGSLQYWLLLSSAVLIPLFSIAEIAKVLIGPARLLLILVIAGGGWHFLRGDYSTVLQLGLLVYVLAWVASANTRLLVGDLAIVYLVMVGIGAAVTVLTELSPYSFVPGLTVEEFGRWRVSFFPNIAYTGILSLGLFLLLTRNLASATRRPLVLALVTYFLVFSLVRTALIGFVIYLALRWFYQRKRAEWEGKNLTYMLLDKSDENMRPAILADGQPGYVVKVDRKAKSLDGQESLVEAVRNLVAVGDELYRADAKALPNVYFDRNLYQPLFAAGFWKGPEFKRTSQIKTVPVALNEGEARLPLKLREFIQGDPGTLGQRRLYLLRNQSRGKGIGFFEAGGFYPDL